MIRGLYTALITPFDDQNDLDEDGLRINIKFQVEQGVDGLLVLGTTGESPTLSLDEKRRITKIAREETSSKVPLMVGVGSYSTLATIETAKQAEDLGADSLLIVTPYYNKPTQTGIIKHFEKIAASTDLPIIVYNIQGRCAQNIETETLAALKSIPNIAGVKEASGNLSQIMDVIDKIGRKDDFSVLSGDDALTFSVMALGGHGAISVASNIFPKEIKRLISETDRACARDLHYDLLPLFKALFVETNPIPVKAAMSYLGMPAGECRLPLCALTEENHARLTKTLDAYRWSQETKILNV